MSEKKPNLIDASSRDELIRKAQITTNARFAAYRRMNKRNGVSVIIFSLFSIIVIVVSTYNLLFSGKIDGNILIFLSFSLIIISIITVVFQLYEIKQNFEKRAFVLYKCSILLSEFCNDAKLRTKEISLDSLIDRYHQIIREYEENHEDVDYRHVKYNFHNSAKLKVIYFKLNYHLACYGMLYFYIAFSFFSIVVAYLAFFGSF